jgi:hypothetical protein
LPRSTVPSFCCLTSQQATCAETRGKPARATPPTLGGAGWDRVFDLAVDGTGKCLHHSETNSVLPDHPWRLGVRAAFRKRACARSASHGHAPNAPLRVAATKRRRSILDVGVGAVRSLRRSKPPFVLVGPETYSSSERLAVHLRARGRTTIVGSADRRRGRPRGNTRLARHDVAVITTRFAAPAAARHRISRAQRRMRIAGLRQATCAERRERFPLAGVYADDMQETNAERLRRGRAGPTPSARSAPEFLQPKSPRRHESTDECP